MVSGTLQPTTPKIIVPATPILPTGWNAMLLYIYGAALQRNDFFYFFFRHKFLIGVSFSIN